MATAKTHVADSAMRAKKIVIFKPGYNINPLHPRKKFFIWKSTSIHHGSEMEAVRN